MQGQACVPDVQCTYGNQQHFTLLRYLPHTILLEFGLQATTAVESISHQHEAAAIAFLCLNAESYNAFIVCSIEITTMLCHVFETPVETLCAACVWQAAPFEHCIPTGVP